MNKDYRVIIGLEIHAEKKQRQRCSVPAGTIQMKESQM